MWAGWAAIGCFLKKLLGGGGGTSQYGNRNQVTTGTTSGAGSHVVTAGGNVTIGAPPPPEIVRDAEVMSELEESMPDLVRDLREALEESPLVRYILVTPTEAFQSVFGKDWFKFSKERYPNIYFYMDILKDYDLVVEEDRNFVYLLTGKLVKLVRRR
jgi:hypothetical protein